MRRPIMTAALLFTALTYPGFAQSPTDHEAHHPGQMPAPTQMTPPAGQFRERQGMMGGGDMMGMMAHGMMGHGTMGGDQMGPPLMFRIVFALADTDGDGTLSLQEFQAAHERIFKAMDANKDGKLTLEEMLAFMRGTRSSPPQ